MRHWSTRSRAEAGYGTRRQRGLIRRQRRGRVAERRVARSEQEEIGVGARLEAQAEHAECLQAVRHTAGDQRDEPVADGDEVERDLQRVEDDQARQREQPAEEDREAVLTHRRIDLDIDGIAAAGAERRKRVGQDVGVREHARRVAQIAADEVVQAEGHPSCEQRREPGDDLGEEDPDRIDREHDHVRDDQDQPEEDRQPRALKVVASDQANGVRGSAHALSLGRAAARMSAATTTAKV